MKLHKIIACAAWPLLIGGCAATTGSSSLQREVDSLKVEVADLKDNSRLADMRGGTADAGEAAEISRLRAQVQQLSENIDSAGDMSGLSLRQQLEMISARLDRLEKKAGLNSLEPASINPEPAATSGGLPTASTSSSFPPGQGVYQGPSESSSSQPAPTAAAGPYEDGKSLYDKKQYRQAISQFKSYLAAEPKGGNAAAAQFYIGEALYAQQQYEEAILEYQKVVQEFPKSSQVPTSLLKQGLSFQSIDDKASAKLLYQKVVRDYPKSYAAGVAKERLKSI